MGQNWQYGGLRWWMSFCCPFCGARYEADGRDIPPADIRAAVLAEEGEWELRVPDAAAPKIAIARTLRRELSLSLPQSAALLRKIPGVFHSGTNSEMRWLAQLLLEECDYRAFVCKSW